jgi:hypothetical protein
MAHDARVICSVGLRLSVGERIVYAVDNSVRPRRGTAYPNKMKRYRAKAALKHEQGASLV